MKHATNNNATANVNVNATEKYIRLNDWTFFGIDELTGVQRAAMMAAIEMDQMHPEFVKRVFHFDGTVSVNPEDKEVRLNPTTVAGWHLKGQVIPSRIEAKKLAAVLEENPDSFTAADVRRVFGHMACVIDRDTKEVTLWRVYGTNIGMGDTTYPILDQELAHVQHGQTEANIRKKTGHRGPISIDEQRCELSFRSF